MRHQVVLAAVIVQKFETPVIVRGEYTIAQYVATPIIARRRRHEQPHYRLAGEIVIGDRVPIRRHYGQVRLTATSTARASTK